MVLTRSRTLWKVPRRIRFRVISANQRFDLIEPGRTGGGEMDVITRSCCQPLLNFQVFVGSVVIQNQMDFQARLHGLVDPVEKPQELPMPVPGLAYPDHSPSSTFSAANTVVVRWRM